MPSTLIQAIPDNPDFESENLIVKHHWYHIPQHIFNTVWRYPGGRWALVVLLSLCLHLGLFMSFQGQASQRSEPRRFNKIKFRLLRPRPKPRRVIPKPPRPRPPKPRIKKKRPKPKKRKIPKKRPKPKKRKVQKRLPPPPPPNQTPPRRPPPRDTVQPVFGLNMNSLSKGQGKVSMRHGNTTMTEPTANPPKRVEPYQAPQTSAPPPRPSDLFQPVPLFDIDENPREWQKVLAAYPADARRDGIEAVVTLSVQIRRNGRVRRARVISIRPPQAARYDFTKAAVRALRRYRFRPAKAKGKAVDVTIRYVYRFELDE